MPHTSAIQHDVAHKAHNKLIDFIKNNLISYYLPNNVVSSKINQIMFLDNLILIIKLC